MEQLKAIENTLMSTIQSQMGNLHNVDTKELGEAIDMIKDLEEAMYYCTITKAMEEKKDEHTKYYIPYDYNNEPHEAAVSVVREVVKYIDKPQRKITEIRVFFDDGTYEVFNR